VRRYPLLMLGFWGCLEGVTSSNDTMFQGYDRGTASTTGVRRVGSVGQRRRGETHRKTPEEEGGHAP
jgi:hypothetical protein